MEHFRSNLILLTAALIWGCAFIAQSVGSCPAGVSQKGFINT